MLLSPAVAPGINPDRARKMGGAGQSAMRATAAALGRDTRGCPDAARVGRGSVKGASDTMVTEDNVLNALDKPRKLFSIQQLTDPSGSSDALQTLLMKMRDAGKVAFDIKKGAWRKL